MKDWKQYAFVGFLAIITISFVFFACGGDNDPKCNCPNGTVHYVDEEPCCNGLNCTCTYIPRPVPCDCAPNTVHYVDEEPCCNGVDCSCTFTKKYECACIVDLHLVGEICCDHNIYNCDCETNVVGQRVHGIAVINQDNVPNFTVMVENVAYALDLFETTGGEYLEKLDYIKAHITVIKIVTAGSGIPSDPAGGVFTVGAHCDGDTILGTLDTWVDQNM